MGEEEPGWGNDEKKLEVEIRIYSIIIISNADAFTMSISNGVIRLSSFFIARSSSRVLCHAQTV